MGTVAIAAFAGWLTLVAPPPADAPQAKASKKPVLSEDARIEQADELTKQASALWEQGKLDLAAKKFEQAVALDPDSGNAWNGLGWARFNGGKTEEAIAAFEKCLALEPDQPAALNGLGQAYLSKREYEKAEQYLIKAAPKAPPAWYGLARLYMLLGKYTEAQTYINKVLALQPSDETMKQCLTAAQKGELPAELRKQIEPPKVDNSPAAKLAKTGWVQFNSGKTRSAERSFRQALAKDPENLAAMNGLGFLMLNTGKTADAKAFFEKYLQKEPDAAGPMNGLARCLKKLESDCPHFFLFTEIGRPANNLACRPAAAGGMDSVSKRNGPRRRPMPRQIAVIAPPAPGSPRGRRSEPVVVPADGSQAKTNAGDTQRHRRAAARRTSRRKGGAQ